MNEPLPYQRIAFWPVLGYPLSIYILTSEGFLYGRYARKSQFEDAVGRLQQGEPIEATDSRRFQAIPLDAIDQVICSETSPKLVFHWDNHRKTQSFATSAGWIRDEIFAALQRQLAGYKLRKKRITLRFLLILAAAVSLWVFTFSSWENLGFYARCACVGASLVFLIPAYFSLKCLLKPYYRKVLY